MLNPSCRCALAQNDSTKGFGRGDRERLGWKAADDGGSNLLGLGVRRRQPVSTVSRDGDGERLKNREERARVERRCEQDEDRWCRGRLGGCEWKGAQGALGGLDQLGKWFLC